MKTISLWARHHRTKAVTLIVLIKLTLALLAIYTGILLNKQGLILSPVLLFVALLGFIAAVSLYPSGENKNRKFTLRKCCDYTIIMAAFISIACFANNRQSIPSAGSSSFGNAGIKGISPSPTDILNSLKDRERSSLSRHEKRILKKEFFKQVKVFALAKASGDKQKAGDAALIILAIIAALGLAYLLAALVCTIACNGSEALAVIITVLGLAGIIIGTVLVIKAIKRRGSKG